MGSSTTAAAVPFLARANTRFDIGDAQNGDELNKKLAILANPFCAYESEILDDEVGEEDDYEYNSWIMNQSKVVTYKGLHLNVWRKDKLKVYVVNESEYESVGIMEMSFFSKTKEDLVEFLKDQELDFKIKSSQAVKQTL